MKKITLFKSRSSHSHWTVKDFNPNEFIWIASHELKTPLTALKLQVEMAKKSLDHNTSGLSQDKLKSIMNRTHHDIGRLTKLVDDMLDVSMINAGTFSMNFEFFELGDFFENLIEKSFINSPDRKRISCKFNAPELVKWDRVRIEQAVLNLLTIALQYGGTSPIDLSVHSGGGFAYIEVRDYGPHDKRIDQQSEKEILGLRLYICNQIIKLHDGQLVVRKKTGEGAKYKIQLPLKSGLG